MKVFLAFAAALALSATAASAQTVQQSTPTVNGSTSPKSAPPAQAPGSLGTLPAQNTQPAADQADVRRTSTKDRSGKTNKDMKKPRDKKKVPAEQM